MLKSKLKIHNVLAFQNIFKNDKNLDVPIIVSINSDTSNGDLWSWLKDFFYSAKLYKQSLNLTIHNIYQNSSTFFLLIKQGAIILKV